MPQTITYDFTAMIDRTVAPETHQITGSPLPEQSVRTLANGVRLYILDRPDMDVLRIGLVWDDGKSTVPRAISMPVMARMLTQGAGEYSAEQVNDMLDYHGAWFKCDSATHYTTVMLSALAGNVVKVLPLLASMIERPRFEADAFVPVRDSIAARTDIALTRVVTHSGYSAARQMFGPAHPESYVVTGKDITALTRDDIIASHRDIMMSMRPTVYYAGPATDGIIGAIADTIGAIRFGDRHEPHVGTLSPDESLRTIVTHHPDTMQAAITLSIPTIGREHPDYINLRLAVTALGGYFGSRLMSNIREDKGYTYGINAGLLGYREGGIVSIRTQADCSYVDPLIAEVLHEVERLRDEPPAGDELEQLRRYAMSTLLMTVDNPFSISDYYIQHQTLHTPDNYFGRQIEAITALTPDTIAAMAARYIRPADIYTAIATK